MALFLACLPLCWAIGCASKPEDPESYEEKTRGVVKQHLTEIKKCYVIALDKTPGIHGKLVLLWTIGPEGKVRQASVKSSTLNNPELETCAVDTLKSWVFPSPPAGEVATASYPFVFDD